MWKAVFTVLALPLAFSGSASAQSSPFSGTWASTSTPGRTWVVEHAASEISQRVIFKDKELRTNKWTIDGPPFTLPNALGATPAQTTASEDGQFLVFQGPIQLPGASALFRQTWHLGEASSLIVTTRVETIVGGTTFTNQETFKKQQ